MFINSENTPGYWYENTDFYGTTREWYPDFIISDDRYIQYRYSSLEYDEYYQLHLGTWNNIYPNEYIESKTYTNL